MTRLARPALLACLLAAGGLGGCTRLYFGALNRGAVAPAPAGVVYRTEADLRLDVYPARAPGPGAVVVFLYGGRWQGGRRQDYAFVGHALAARGMTAVLADYRHYPEAAFPAFVEDAAAAVAWARRHASEIGGRPDAVFVAGHSAGAHIAALLGTDARYLAAHGLRPRDLAGVIGVAGPYDFLPLVDEDLIAIFGADPKTQAASQPVLHVDGDEPPFLLLHGQSDLLVWAANSQRLKARLDAVGVPAELHLYPGVGHVRILASLRHSLLAPTLADLADFVQRHAAVATAEAGRP